MAPGRIVGSGTIDLPSISLLRVDNDRSYSEGVHHAIILFYYGNFTVPLIIRDAFKIILRALLLINHYSATPLFHQ